MSESRKHSMSVTEAATELGCHPEHVRRLCRSQMLVAHRTGKRWYLDPESVARYARGQGNRRLAIEWLALVADKRQGPKVTELLRRTFRLPFDDIQEMLRVWGLNDKRARQLVADRRGQEVVGDLAP